MYQLCKNIEVMIKCLIFYAIKIAKINFENKNFIRAKPWKNTGGKINKLYFQTIFSFIKKQQSQIISH